MHEVRKSVAFKCRECQGAAKIIEADGQIDGIYCPACGVSLDGGSARTAYQSLREQMVEKEGLNVVRRLVKGRVRRVPPRKASYEISDPRWPFVMVVEDEV